MTAETPVLGASEYQAETTREAGKRAASLSLTSCGALVGRPTARLMGTGGDSLVGLCQHSAWPTEGAESVAFISCVIM